MATPKEVKTVIKVAPPASDQVIHRLGVLLGALELMEHNERSAALTYLKSRYRDDWPSDCY